MRNKFHQIKKVDENGNQITNFKKWRVQYPNDEFFDSRLEYSAMREFKKAKLDVCFHPESIILQDKFRATTFEKAELKEKGIRKMSYTLDFIIKHDDKEYHIEMKGHEEEAFKMRWKLYLNSVKNDDNIIPCLVKSVKEIKALIKEIKT